MLFLLLVVFLLLFGNRLLAQAIPGELVSKLTPIDKWNRLCVKYAGLSGNLKPEEIKSIIMIESSGNPASVNPLDPSYGLMGVTPLIGKAYAGISKTTDLLKPETNVKAGSRFLSDLKKKYKSGYQGEWVQAYNLGETKFLKGKRVPKYQTRFENFVTRFRVDFQVVA